jgi:uncharacterized short protein YbdD (DUF466 family)
MRDRARRLVRAAAVCGAGAARVLRTAIGVPDYERYAAHMRARHPGMRLLTRDEFVRERLEARYSRPGARCC